MPNTQDAQIMKEVNLLKIDMMKEVFESFGFSLKKTENNSKLKNPYDKLVLEGNLSTGATGGAVNGDWPKAVQEMGKWFESNVHTYQGTLTKPRAGRKAHSCPLIGGKTVWDDCSAFVEACLIYAGAIEWSGHAKTTEAMCRDIEKNGPWSTSLKNFGFQILTFNRAELQPFDIYVGALYKGGCGHTEIVAEQRGKQYGWGSIHDGQSGHPGMPCGWDNRTNYNYTLRCNGAQTTGLTPLASLPSNTNSGITTTTTNVKTPSTTTKSTGGAMVSVSSGTGWGGSNYKFTDAGSKAISDIIGLTGGKRFDKVYNPKTTFAKTYINTNHDKSVNVLGAYINSTWGNDIKKAAKQGNGTTSTSGSTTSGTGASDTATANGNTSESLDPGANNGDLGAGAAPLTGAHFELPNGNTEFAKNEVGIDKKDVSIIDVILNQTIYRGSLGGGAVDGTVVLGGDIAAAFGDRYAMALEESKRYLSGDYLARAKQAYAGLTKYGLNKQAACSAIGVFLSENGCKPESYCASEKNGNGKAGKEPGGRGYGAGIASWTFINTKMKALNSIGISNYVPIESLSMDQQCKMYVNKLKGDSWCVTNIINAPSLEHCSVAAMFNTHGRGRPTTLGRYGFTYKAAYEEQLQQTPRLMRFAHRATPSKHHLTGLLVRIILAGELTKIL